MPWTADDMRRKGAKRPEQAARIANAIRSRCLSDGGSESACDRIAIATALARTNKPPKTGA